MSGALLAASGQIAKLGEGRMMVATEVATIGIRGTTVWGGVIDGQWGVVLLEGAGVSVENRAGRVELTEADSGTAIKSAGQGPGALKRWSRAKLAKARKAVSFD